MMERYRFLEHTADAKMQAFGKDLEEAFSNAALGMFSLMFEPEKVEPKTEKEIDVEGKDRQALLYNWLEELIFLLDSDGFLLHEVKKLSIEGSRLHAVITGDKISDKYESHGDVKAVTYNEMDITQKPGKVTVQAVFDL
ncbi:protein archease [Candidatus Woesearchaeota archaeon]|nr:protein archease [Candidatus Woesearchaeota archaeon]